MYQSIDNSAIITNAVFSSDGSTITYTYSSPTNGPFSVGQLVNISGIVATTDTLSTDFNLSDAVIISIGTNTFTTYSMFAPTVNPVFDSGRSTLAKVEHDSLRETINTSTSVKINSLIIGEWNLNISQNITNVGNYKNRPNPSDYFSLSQTFSNEDSNTISPTWYGYTDSTILVNGGVTKSNDGTDVDVSLLSPQNKMKYLYSLTDTTGKFRPRSGINKMLYLQNNNSKAGSRTFSIPSEPKYFGTGSPRYYVSDMSDFFKYWTSFRFDSSDNTNIIERGISNIKVASSSEYYIDDVAPFMTYSDVMPANRIVVKMQTHVGSVDYNGNALTTEQINAAKTTPVNWKIQYLDSTNAWKDAVSFNSLSTRRDGSAIVKQDGYVELAYGLNIPTQYYSIFSYAGTYSSSTSLPAQSIDGYAYLVEGIENNGAGTFYIWIGNGYQTFVPQYTWFLNEESIDRNTPYVTQTVDTSTKKLPSYIDSSGNRIFKEFQYIKGIRIVVNTMKDYDETFDLIEMSARLAVDLSNKTKSFSLRKMASDLAQSGLPVGQLMVSTGSIALFDYDKAFSDNNSISILSKFSLNSRYKPIRKRRLKPPKKSKSSSSYIQIKLYDIIGGNDGYDYYVPLKTMYVDGFPQIGNTNREVDIQLRDLYFWFESIIAPQIMLTDVSVSVAISCLLDSIGFSNYAFRRVANSDDPIIPYFFIKPDTTIAQVLNDIASSFQMAMFFDEYNNLIIMSKEYLLPEYNTRETDLTIYGSKNQYQDMIIENKRITTPIPSIVDIKLEQDKVFNDGKINYTTRYIQKSPKTVESLNYSDNEISWVYKPVLLWESTPLQNTKPSNEQLNQQKGSVLTAIPLSSDLSNSLPTVIVNPIYPGDPTKNILINNTMDLGESVMWLETYNGYFYANGEIIKFDAIEYDMGESLLDFDGNVVGPKVWVTSTNDYQYYFSKVKFGKKIFPTGKVRIYAEPNYQIIYSGDNPSYDKDGNIVVTPALGAVAKHGRGQFGTEVVAHTAGLDSYWQNIDGTNSNIYGCYMNSDYLFGNKTSYPALIFGNKDTAKAGTSPKISLYAKQTTTNSFIKNILSSQNVKESIVQKTKAADKKIVQASALKMQGTSPTDSTISKSEYGNNKANLISYIYKDLNSKTSYKTFGTKVRILGSLDKTDAKNVLQKPNGNMPYYQTVNGSSGGLAIGVNPTTNYGYYFEIAALTTDNIDSYSKGKDLNNVFFYKIGKDSSLSVKSTDAAIPKVLYSGLSQIIVDPGIFSDQVETAESIYPTTYDLSISYKVFSKKIVFSLYINNALIATVEDNEPLLVNNNGIPRLNNSLALFVRGASELMFENVYAISPNTNYSNPQTPANKDALVIDVDNINMSQKETLLPSAVKDIFLQGLSPITGPTYSIYYEEFGTIMREVVHYNIKYDKAYPALYAKIAPTITQTKKYGISNFVSNPYGAEFLIFNLSDSVLRLDDTTGNYLRIIGITFTQASPNQLSVDDYFLKKSNFADVATSGVVTESPVLANATYTDIKNSRTTYGKNAFNLDALYIQDQNTANDLMKWISSKIMQPRFSVGLEIFANPTIQLGDIVEVVYDDKDGNPEVAVDGTRFVVYSIQYDRDNAGPVMIVYLSEVA